MKKALPALFALFLGFSAMSFAAPAFAQDAAEERSETFEAADPGAQTENIPGGMLMVVAYGAVWVLVAGYVMALGFRQARTQRELEALRQDLVERGSSED